MPRQKRKHNLVSPEEETTDHEKPEDEKIDIESTVANDDNSDDDSDDILLKPVNIFAEEKTGSPKMSKRPRINFLEDLLDSPCSSTDDISPSTSVEYNDSNASRTADIVDLQGSPNSPEIIDLINAPNPDRASSGVVDLTAEPTTPTITNDVVDLTEDLGDSSPITIVSVNKIFERPRSFDLEQINDEISVNTSNNASSSSSGSSQQDDSNNKSGISCPICFDDIQVLKRRKRQLSSTVCGHVFCDKCIKNAFKTQNKCPTCRKKLSMRQIHPLFL